MMTPLRPLTFIAYFYALAAIMTAFYFSAPWTEVLGLFLFSSLSSLQLILGFALVQGLIAVHKSKSINPIRWFTTLDTLLASAWHDSTFRQGLKITLILFPVFFAFTAFKSLIPLINPYNLDPLFSHIDLTMHGGIYPHQWFGSWIHQSWLIRSSEITYYAWFLVLIAANTYAVFYDKNEKRRTHYLYASVVSWIMVGTVMATALSSVGPIFYDNFYDGMNPYSDLKDIYHTSVLNGAVLWSEAVTLLLNLNRDTTICDLNGISAMPSMHVGVTFMITLYAFSVNRVLGLFSALFTLVIFLSSIILGFHYAIDGYASIVVMGAIWLILKRLIK